MKARKCLLENRSRLQSTSKGSLFSLRVLYHSTLKAGCPICQSCARLRHLDKELARRCMRGKIGVSRRYASNLGACAQQCSVLRRRQKKGREWRQCKQRRFFSCTWRTCCCRCCRCSCYSPHQPHLMARPKSPVVRFCFAILVTPAPGNVQIPKEGTMDRSTLQQKGTITSPLLQRQAGNSVPRVCSCHGRLRANLVGLHFPGFMYRPFFNSLLTRAPWFCGKQGSSWTGTAHGRPPPR